MLSASHTSDELLVEASKQNKKNSNKDRIILKELSIIKDSTNRLDVKKREIESKTEKCIAYYHSQIQLIRDSTFNKIKQLNDEAEAKIAYYQSQIDDSNERLERDINTLDNKKTYKNKVLNRRATEIKTNAAKEILKEEILEESESEEEVVIPAPVVVKKTKKAMNKVVVPQESELQKQYKEYHVWRDKQGDRIFSRYEVKEKFPLVGADLEQKIKLEEKRIDKEWENKVVPKDEKELQYEEEQQRKNQLIERRIKRMDELREAIESLKAKQYAEYDVSEDWEANPGYQKLRLEIARCKNMIEEMKQNPSLLL